MAFGDVHHRARGATAQPQVQLSVAVLAEGEFHLVAEAALGGRGDDGQHVGVAQAADAAKGVDHEAFLPAQLLGVGQVLPGAAATVAEMGAERGALRGRGFEHGVQRGLGEAALHRGQPGPYPLAGQAARHEHDAALVAAHGAAARGKAVNGQFQKVAGARGGIGHDVSGEMLWMWRRGRPRVRARLFRVAGAARPREVR